MWRVLQQSGNVFSHDSWKIIIWLTETQQYIWREVGRKCKHITFLILCLTPLATDRLIMTFVCIMVFKVIKSIIVCKHYKLWKWKPKTYKATENIDHRASNRYRKKHLKQMEEHKPWNSEQKRICYSHKCQWDKLTH